MNEQSPEYYWNDVYAKKAFAAGKDASSFLKSMIPRLQKGKALEIASGEGVNSVFLAKQGYQVKAFDISEVALARAHQWAQENGVSIEFKKQDLDLFLFGLMEYESILMFNFKPSVSRYYSDIVRALKQGGTLLVEAPMVEEMTEAIGRNESHKNYFFECNELLHHLKGLKILYYSETIVDGRHVVQCLAKKPSDKDAAKYNLFDMQAKNADTGPSKHQKLAEALFKK